MNHWLELAGSLTAGLLSGWLFFGGLWLTVKRGMKLKNPAVLFLGSFLLRSAVTLCAFYYTSSGSWQHLALCIAGFLLARQFVFFYTKESKPSGVGPNKL